MCKFVREINRYYHEMNRLCIWFLWLCVAFGLILLVSAVIIPHTSLPATHPVLAADLIDQCREAGFGTVTVGLLLSCLGDVIVKYDHVDI